MSELPYTYSCLDGSNKHIRVLAGYTVTEEESYKTGAIFIGTMDGYQNFGRYTHWSETCQSVSVIEQSPHGRYAILVPSYKINQQYPSASVCIDTDCRNIFGGGSVGLLRFNSTIKNEQTGSSYSDSAQTFPVYSNVAINTGYDTDVEFMTNIPVFKVEDTDKAVEYVYTNSDATALNILKNYCINFEGSPVEPESGDVYINNYGVLQKWTVDGKEEVQSTGLIYRTFKMKVVQGSIAFYKIEGIDNDMLKAGIKYSQDFNAISIGYSEDGGNTWTYVDQLPYNFIFRTRENELGEFYACPVEVTTNDTNIPLWENETDADDYIAGNKDITDALNWSTISNKYPIINGTGTGDNITEFGEVYARSYFSQQYIMSGSAVQEVATALFDTDATGTTHMWDRIKEGLGMYGNDPMQSVQGLMYFPVSLSEVFTNYQPQQYVYFGGFKLDLQNGCKKIVHANGYKSIGTIVIKRTFKNWRDYFPFSKCYVYLPYVGTYEIDLARYYDKTTEVRYYIDTRTGGCCACLIADGILLDYFNGQMGVQMPITLTDKSAYANAQIQTLIGGIKKEGDIITGGIKTGQATGSWYGSAVQWSAGTMLNASFTTHDLTDNNINNYNKTKGGSSSMLNEYLPQYVTFMFEIQQDDPTDNHDRLLGLPSNASGNVGDFSGYLQVESVNLVCGIATPNEKKEILNALFNGIII